MGHLFRNKIINLSLLPNWIWKWYDYALFPPPIPNIADFKHVKWVNDNVSTSSSVNYLSQVRKGREGFAKLCLVNWQERNNKGRFEKLSLFSSVNSSRYVLLYKFGKISDARRIGCFKHIHLPALIELWPKLASNRVPVALYSAPPQLQWLVWLLLASLAYNFIIWLVRHWTSAMVVMGTIQRSAILRLNNSSYIKIV